MSGHIYEIVGFDAVCCTRDESALTYGETYHILSTQKVKRLGGGYQSMVKNDDGDFIYYDQTYFLTIKEARRRKLYNLLQ